MFVFLILLFIFVCCISVYFYYLLKLKDKEIDELYDLIYSHIDGDLKKEFDRCRVVKLC